MVTDSRRLLMPAVIDTLIEPDLPNFVNEAKYYLPFSFWNLNLRIKPSVPTQQPSAAEGIHHTPFFSHVQDAFYHRHSDYQKTSLFRSCWLVAEAALRTLLLVESSSGSAGGDIGELCKPLFRLLNWQSRKRPSRLGASYEPELP